MSHDFEFVLIAVYIRCTESALTHAVQRGFNWIQLSEGHMHAIKCFIRANKSRNIGISREI